MMIMQNISIKFSSLVRQTVGVWLYNYSFRKFKYTKAINGTPCEYNENPISDQALIARSILVYTDACPYIKDRTKELISKRHQQDFTTTPFQTLERICNENKRHIRY